MATIAAIDHGLAILVSPRPSYAQFHRQGERHALSPIKPGEFFDVYRDESVSGQKGG
jgi:hypothetical protein